ncbi:hypothetical protein BHM03_00015451 [Ensete ventricosum]|nr:hypothetical protein BHM03_00015451 [Ensete ventricosum]
MKRGRWSEYTEAWPAPISSRSELSVNLGLGPSVKSLASGDHTRCVTSPGWVSVYKATPVGVDHSSASRVTTDPSRLNPPPHRLVATPTANTSCCSTQDNENRDGQVASSRRLIRPMRTADARLGQERKRSQFSRRDSAIGNRVGITPCGSCGGARVLAGVGDGRAVDQGGAGKAWRVLRRGD